MTILYHGCCRDQKTKLWFWYAGIRARQISVFDPRWQPGCIQHGWSKSRAKAQARARAAAERLAVGRDCTAVVSHVVAEDHLLRVQVEFELDWESAHGIGTFDIAEMIADVIAPRDLPALKAKMVAAHPDKGGTAARFIKARAKYEAARRATRRWGKVE